MPELKKTIAKYCSEIADQELLGREGEITLARKIEELEVEVWHCLLAFEPAVQTIVRSLERGGLEHPDFEILRKASAHSKRKKAAGELATSSQLYNVAAHIRENDRDRVHLAVVLDALNALSMTSSAAKSWNKTLTRALSAAADARQVFIRSNLRFVVSMCRKYAGYGLPMEDLIQEGNIGLMKGVDRFDYRRGYRFSTYAGWWIRHSLTRALADASRTVRIPVHIQDTHQQILQAQRAIASRLGREASDEEIAEHCEISVDKVVLIKSSSLGVTVSLDETVGEGGASRMDQLIDAANDERSPLDAIVDEQEGARVVSLLSTLPETQADVLRKRFGLDGNAPMTLRRIGEEYGLSRERVRQIEGMALRTLRSTMERERPRRLSALP